MLPGTRLAKVAVMLLGRTSWAVDPRTEGLMAAKLQDRRRVLLQQAGGVPLPCGSRTTKEASGAASSSVPEPATWAI